jgi:Raf kinase inhibitor-like YbhB/YbcL family protein
MIRRRFALMFGIMALFVAALAIACSSSDGGAETGAAGDEPGAPPAAAADDESDVPTGEAGYQLVQKFETNVQVTSTAFDEKRRIPKTNACVEVEFITGAPSTNVKSKRENKSTPLTWGELPEGTVSVALVVDSDQGTTVGVHKPVYLDPTYFDKFKKGAKWVHWVIWNIPADAGGLEQGAPTTTAALPDIGPQTMQGTNSELEVGYYGPCPPPATVYHGRPAVDQVKFTYTFTLYALDKVIEGLGAETTKDALLKAIDGSILGSGVAVGEHTATIIKKAS